MKLYEITEQFKQLEKMEGIDPIALGDTIDSIKGDITEKGKSVAAYFQNLDAEAAAMKDAEDRISNRRKAIEKDSAFLKEYLLRNMKECEISEISCPEFKITLRKPRKVVSIEGVNALDDEYLNRTTTYTANKKLIKERLNKGVNVKGAELIDGKTSLIIK